MVLTKIIFNTNLGPPCIGQNQCFISDIRTVQLSIRTILLRRCCQLCVCAYLKKMTTIGWLVGFQLNIYFKKVAVYRVSLWSCTKLPLRHKSYNAPKSGFPCSQKLINQIANKPVSLLITVFSLANTLADNLFEQSIQTITIIIMFTLWKPCLTNHVITAIVKFITSLTDSVLSYEKIYCLHFSTECKLFYC